MITAYNNVVYFIIIMPLPPSIIYPDEIRAARGQNLAGNASPRDGSQTMETAPQGADSAPLGTNPSCTRQIKC